MQTTRTQMEDFRKTHYQKKEITLANKYQNMVKRETVNPSGKYEQMYQDFQSVSANICHVAKSSNIKTIGIVSPQPSSGTSTSMAFVSYMVAADSAIDSTMPSDDMIESLISNNQILVIDAQLSNPSLHQKFNVPVAPGFSELFPYFEHGVNPLESIPFIKDIKNTNIKIIPGGSQQRKHLTLDHISKLKHYIASIQEQYSYVFVDLPPLLTNSDAASLAGVCDAVILVIEAGKTKKSTINQALNKLSQLNIKVVGTILNRQKSYVPQWLQKLV